MCDRVVSENPFMIIYCLDRYRNQRICDEHVNDRLKAFKFITDWFVPSDDILFFNEDFNKVTFITNRRYILIEDLGKVKLEKDNNFDENDLHTIIHVRILARRSKLENHKGLEKR